MQTLSEEIFESLQSQTGHQAKTTVCHSPLQRLSPHPISVCQPLSICSPFCYIMSSLFETSITLEQFELSSSHLHPTKILKPIPISSLHLHRNNEFGPEALLSIDIRMSTYQVCIYKLLCYVND